MTIHSKDDIRCKRVFSPNLFVENDSLCLDPKVARRVGVEPPPIGAISFVAERLCPSITHDTLVDVCAEDLGAFFRAVALFDEYSLLLFTAFSVWRPRLSDDRMRKLLVDRVQLSPLASGVVGPERGLGSSGGVRYAGLLTVDLTTLAIAARLCRSDTGTFLVLSGKDLRHDAETLERLFVAAFPRSRAGDSATSVNWTHCTLLLAASGVLPIRVSGAFDDRDVGIDIIGERSTLESFLARVPK